MGVGGTAGSLKRGTNHRRGVARGGQLEVAGVVVGSWGPNFGGPRGRGGVSHGSGADSMGRGRANASVTQSARTNATPVSYSTRGGRVSRGRRGAFQQGAGTRSKTTPAQSNFKGSRTNNENHDGQ
jgi:hypothetical protein